MCQKASATYCQFIATFGKLQDAGIELNEAPSQPAGPDLPIHHNAKLPDPVGESSVQTFVDCFDMPIENPRGGKEQV